MYIYRNYTIELLFQKFEVEYSGYGEISKPVIEIQSNLVIFFYNLNPVATEEEIIKELNGIHDKINFLFNQNELKKNVLIIIPDINFYSKIELSSNLIEESYYQFRKFIIELSNKNKSIKYVEFNEFTKLVGKVQLIDWKFFYTSQIIINPKLTSLFTHWFNNVLKTINYNRKKCLVLDCDNTLWGGIIGEDGIAGIKIGNTYPGNVYRDFQQKLVELYRKGIILAICSKNNFSDVEEVFLTHPEMILKIEHISSFRINWENKAQNIREIASELNIGLDSIVFIDDNPSERELVKFNISEVEVPEFPSSEYEIMKFFNSVCEDNFASYIITEDDKNKTKQYYENSKRHSFRASFTNVEEYLMTLNININIQFVNKLNITRLSQMTQKTNQFNLTTKRYSETDLDTFEKEGNWVICASVADKFGDNGVTILTIFKFNQHTAEIDTYLLSCRILGRGVEKIVLQYLLNQLFDKGIKKVEATYIPTAKNTQAKYFYEDLGFECINESEDGIKNYALNLLNKIEIKNYYKIKMI